MVLDCHPAALGTWKQVRERFLEGQLRHFEALYLTMTLLILLHETNIRTHLDGLILVVACHAEHTPNQA